MAIVPYSRLRLAAVASCKKIPSALTGAEGIGCAEEFSHGGQRGRVKGTSRPKGFTSLFVRHSKEIMAELQQVFGLKKLPSYTSARLTGKLSLSRIINYENPLK